MKEENKQIYGDLIDKHVSFVQNIKHTRIYALFNKNVVKITQLLLNHGFIFISFFFFLFVIQSELSQVELIIIMFYGNFIFLFVINFSSFQDICTCRVKNLWLITIDYILLIYKLVYIFYIWELNVINIS